MITVLFCMDFFRVYKMTKSRKLTCLLSSKILDVMKIRFKLVVAVVQINDIASPAIRCCYAFLLIAGYTINVEFFFLLFFFII